MRRRRMITTLVGWLMILSLFCTGFAATITFYPPATQPELSGDILTHQLDTSGLEIDPAYYGIAWEAPRYEPNNEGEYTIENGVYVPIKADQEVAAEDRYRLQVKGYRLNYSTKTVGLNTVYTLEGTTVSSYLKIDSADMELRLAANDYRNDVLVINLSIEDFQFVSEKDSPSRLVDANGKTIEGLKIPTSAKVHLPNASYGEVASVAVVDGSLEMCVSISALYGLAGSYKALAGGDVDAIPLLVEFAFEDRGMASDDVKAVCDARQILTIQTATK